MKNMTLYISAVNSHPLIWSLSVFWLSYLYSVVVLSLFQNWTYRERSVSSENCSEVPSKTNKKKKKKNRNTQKNNETDKRGKKGVNTFFFLSVCRIGSFKLIIQIVVLYSEECDTQSAVWQHKVLVFNADSNCIQKKGNSYSVLVLTSDNFL